MTADHAPPGMTVIELVVVIALMGIMAAVVTPSVASFNHRPMERSAEERIAALVRFGRTTAIERATPVDVTIDPTTGRFWVDPPDSIGMLHMPDGIALVSRAPRVHVRIEPNGEATIDEALLVRGGDTTVSVRVGR